LSRRFAAILAANVAGYSRLMGAEEEGTLADLTKIVEHRGRIVKTTGAAVAIRDVCGHRRSAEIQRQEHGELARSLSVFA
jgi:adenylate cyclase